MMAKVPPMGWNSWNTFGWNISEDLLHETTDAFIDNGFKDAGYEYIVIDDCWAEKKRNAEGLMVEDKNKFPHGMKAVGDYIHSRGLKFGMYSCSGTMTCAGYPGSFEHEFDDAKTFAGFGADFLKYDYCYKPTCVPGHILYKRMAMALRNCGRDILFSACNWGADDSDKWMRASGAHMWRATGDIQDNWKSIKDISLQQIGRGCFGAPYCYKDMDMLVVGMHGKGNVGLGGCTDEEYKTHFSLWSILNSPLMIGCDIRNIDAKTKEILTNKEVIAVNQDAEARNAYRVPVNFDKDDHYILVKLLSDGSYAIGFFNLTDSPLGMILLFWDLGLPSASGYGMQIRDLWKHEDVGVFREEFATENIPAHGCAMYRAKVVKL